MNKTQLAISSFIAGLVVSSFMVGSEISSSLVFIIMTNFGMSMDSNVEGPPEEKQQDSYDALLSIFKIPGSYKNKHTGNYTVDIVSIGTVTDLDKSIAQKETWANHTSRRYFWVATEQDDPNPDCFQELTKDDVIRNVQKCKGGALLKSYNHSNSLKQWFKSFYATTNWIQQKANPGGWLCAQQRPLAALAKVGRAYQQGKVPLPDFLILTDDDTYVNMEIFEQTVLRQGKQPSWESSVPMVYAGCMVRSPVHMINWTIPIGGFGTFFSRGALQRLIQPIYCNSTTTSTTTTNPTQYHNNNNNDNNNHVEMDDFVNKVCTVALQNSLMDEKHVFQDGMSISDIMGAWVSANKHLFCLHSDWSVAYFINFYYLSKHYDEENNYYKDVDHARLHALDNSIFYRKGTGNCKNEQTTCNEHSHVCHRVNRTQMTYVTNQVKGTFPDKYLL